MSPYHLSISRKRRECCFGSSKLDWHVPSFRLKNPRLINCRVVPQHHRALRLGSFVGY